ncbi:MAG: hypothetical protein M3Q55_08400 [Acidobacteriota bacterium]|nr:hypothetical protein [Acidobacteriota bacterium]
MRRLVFALAALAALLPVRSAHAQPAPWGSIDLPAGAPAVRAALGIQSDSPSSELVFEVARKHFYLPGRNDARQPGFARLEQALAGATAGETLRVPLPGSVALWQEATGKAGAALTRALLIERDAALFYTGLAALDAATLEFFETQPALARTIYRQRAPVFAAFARALSVRDGRVVVPGGRTAEGLWTDLTGVTPSTPAPFIDAILKGNDGRLAYFYGALAALDEAHLRFVFGGEVERGDRLRGILRVFATVEPEWRLASQPFRRPSFDPFLALRFARVTAAGELAGDQRTDALTYLRKIFDAQNGARGAVDASASTRRVFEAAAAALRVGPEAGAIRATRPVLGMTLERMGVSDPRLLARVDAAAAALDARLSMREEITVVWQGAMSLLASAARGGSDAASRDAALGELAATVSSRDPFASVLDWLAARVSGQENGLEGALIAWAAGSRAPRSVIWEGQALALDLAASRRAAITRALAHPRRLTLDDVAALREVQELVASRAPLDAGALRARLEPIAARYDGTARVHAPLADGAGALRELLRLAGDGDIESQARHALSVKLLAAWRAALVDTLRGIVYAQTINRPGMLATSANDFARRHRFQPPERVSFAPVGPWELARVVASGELRLDGSLLELDLAMPEQMLRRPSDEMPAEPVMLTGERSALAHAAVLGFDAPAHEGMAETAQAIRAGRASIGEAATPEALVALGSRGGMRLERASLLAWEAAQDPAVARARFSLPEIAAIGGLASAAGWRTSQLSLDGCPCLGPPQAPSAWSDLMGRWDAGLLAAASPDLVLRIIELAASFELPPEIVAPILLVATNDVIEHADPSDPDDREAIARAVARIDAERFEHYMLALITEGTLVPSGGRP